MTTDRKVYNKINKLKTYCTVFKKNDWSADDTDWAESVSGAGSITWGARGLLLTASSGNNAAKISYGLLPKLNNISGTIVSFIYVWTNPFRMNDYDENGSFWGIGAVDNCVANTNNIVGIVVKNDKFYFRVDVAGVEEDFDIDTYMTTGFTHRIDLIFTGSVYECYIDGTKRATSTTAPSANLIILSLAVTNANEGENLAEIIKNVEVSFPNDKFRSLEG